MTLGHKRPTEEHRDLSGLPWRIGNAWMFVVAGHSRPKDGVASARLCPRHDEMIVEDRFCRPPLEPFAPFRTPQTNRPPPGGKRSIKSVSKSLKSAINRRPSDPAFGGLELDPPVERVAGVVLT